MWCIKNTFSKFLKTGSISLWWSYFNIVPFHDYKFQENCFSFSFVELAVQTSCTHHIYTNVILSKVYQIHFSSLMRISKQVAHEAGKKMFFFNFYIMSLYCSPIRRLLTFIQILLVILLHDSNFFFFAICMGMLTFGNTVIISTKLFCQLLMLCELKIFKKFPL